MRNGNSRNTPHFANQHTFLQGLEVPYNDMPIFNLQSTEARTACVKVLCISHGPGGVVVSR